jgi:hypothetical protein
MKMFQQIKHGTREEAETGVHCFEPSSELLLLPLVSLQILFHLTAFD